jgi:iron complex transport system ATP-binding protein
MKFSASDLPLGASIPASGVALACDHLTAHYDAEAGAVLQDISVTLPMHKWTCIVGPNGAGKSSLLMALAGLMPQTKGRVTLLNKELALWPRKEKARALAWLGQKQTGADDLVAEDIVMLGRIPHQSWLSEPSTQDKKVVFDAMQQTQCWAWRNRAYGDLSGGEQQRVLLARALAVQAQVLLMDEPLNNLDPPHQADWLRITRELIAAGKTVVSVLHELPFALLADEMMILNQGRLIHQGPANSPSTHRALEQVFGNRIAVHEVAGQWTALPCV